MDDIILCLDSEAVLLGLFNPGLAPSLLFYAYIPIILVSVFLGIFVLKSKSKFNLPNKLFFLFTALYSIYLINEISQWISIPAGLVSFSWQLIALFFTLLSIILFYFVYTYLEEKDLSLKAKSSIGVLLLPILLLLPTSLNTHNFDILNCVASIGSLYYYIYALMVVMALATAYVALRAFIYKKRKDSLFLGAGAILMITVLMSADLLSEYSGDFEINLVGPLGMLAFIFAVTYIIVKFKAFNIKLAGAQALVLALITLIGSQFFFVETLTNRLLVAVTFFISILGGYFLVKSVKKEIKQREQLEALTAELEAANVKLTELDKLKSEFVSIASHQLRSPLTAIRGYASMLAEGSFGKLPEKAQEPAERIEESAKLMATAVEDYLNVSRIESGNMKYNLSDFNLRDKVEGICDDLRPEALKQSLILIFRTDLKSRGVINADVGKTVQIIHNLINNSIKYTPKGTISIFMRDDIKNKKIFVEISDTGIGMSQKTMDSLFAKFSRADNANSVNVSGTGLGLFVARKMANAMDGDITVSSEGDGKGSRFTLEMPLAM